jgi:hypothetical protein
MYTKGRAISDPAIYVIVHLLSLKGVQLAIFFGLSADHLERR